MKIYFEDGELYTSKYLPITNYEKVDAKYGISANMIRLDLLKKTDPNTTVYTNSIMAFCNEYAWNEELEVPEIYIRAGEHMIFTRIDKLTNRELRRAHNLAKMYVAGEFENEFNYKEEPMNYIPDWNKKNLRCHFCDETKSVKYTMKIFDPVVANEPTEVCVCNKCALQYNDKHIKE